MSPAIRYPRRVFIRRLLLGIGRVVLALLTRQTITGKGNYPKRGPYIMVGNHSGGLEAVMMAAHCPHIPEFMAAIDIPHEPFFNFFITNYGIIPVFRGNVSRETMQQAIDVLQQGGVIAIFPEGGTWEPAIRTAQPGVAWISAQSGAPVLPIGFGDAFGKIDQAFKLKQPALAMNIGELLPAVTLPKGKGRREALQAAADAIMDAVWALIPEQEHRAEAAMRDEHFELTAAAMDAQGTPIAIPDALTLHNGAWVSRITHRLNLINTFRDPLQLPVQPLKELDADPPAGEILSACQVILDYVDAHNPYYFTYRYGQEDGAAMHASVRELRDLARWAADHGHRLQLRAIHRYTDPDSGETVTRLRPDEVARW